jgi:transposase
MFDFSSSQILAYNRAVDMRKSFSGLLGVVRSEVQLSPLSKTVFLFFNKRKNYIKLLFWDRTGFCLVCKKLEKGSFSLPSEDDLQSLDLEKLKLIFDGIKLGKRS